MKRASTTLKIGVLGVARITPEALVRPASEINGVELAGIASRERRRAQTFADQYVIYRVFDAYQALLDDPEIDAIYIPLPNSLHCEWTIRALEAGKHVLCEKPLSSNAHEARKMVSAADRTGLILMDALHYRYHPLMERIRELVPSLGPLLHIETKFCFLLPRFKDIRYHYSLGGGATMDVGVYTSDMMLQVAAASGDPALVGSPQVIQARAKLLGSNIDRFMEADLLWNNGTSGRITHSIFSRQVPGVKLKVTGERGQLHVSNPVTPHRGHQIDVRIDGKSHQENVAGKTSYHYQLLEFERRIREESRSPDLDDSVATMELLDAVYTAAGLPLRGI